MPRGDQTGPMGKGPMSGRRAGRCANSGARERNLSGFGTGGHGCRRMYYETGLPGFMREGEDVQPIREKDVLKAEVERLEKRMSELQEEIFKMGTAVEDKNEASVQEKEKSGGDPQGEPQ